MKHTRMIGSFFEASVISGENLIFDAHGHDEFVISANLKGDEQLNLDGKAMNAPEGNVTLFNPAQIQIGNGTQKIVSLYLEPQYFTNLHETPNNIEFTMPIAEDSTLLHLMEALNKLILDKDTTGHSEEMVIYITNYLATSYINYPIETAPQPCFKRATLVREHMMDDLSKKPNLRQMAIDFNVSIPTLISLFTTETGYSPIRWQRIQRLKKARELLKRGKRPVDIASDLGFADQSHLTRLFYKSFGETPAKFAKVFNKNRHNNKE